MQNVLNKLDNFQRAHWLPSFIFAVIKKYGEDEAGSQAALLTYYAFLSLFPLILVLTTVTTLISGSHPELQSTIIKGTTNYFPVLGNQLSSHVKTLHESGFALVVGLLFTVYGARGVAGAFQTSVQRLWRIPRSERPGFPKSLLKNLGIIAVVGIGFITASVSIALASAAGHGTVLKALTIVINLIVWFLVFILLLDLSLPKHVSFKETQGAAICAAIGLVIVQTLGGYLLKRQLQHLDALYSYFALALGLLFWIYLQVQVLFYALESAVVRIHHLWPRSLSGKNLTEADHKCLTDPAKIL
jgi:membrane protein